MIAPLVRGTALCAILLFALPAAAIEGSVKNDAGQPIPYAFVSLLSPDYDFLGYAVTEQDGSFAIDHEPAEGRLVVQPPGKENNAALGIYAYAPRVFQLNGEARADVTLPDGGTIVVKGYDGDGNLLRWKDYEVRGTFGAQFVYWTDLNDVMEEAVVWPVHDAASRKQDSPRGMGIPAVVAKPGMKGVVQPLYWRTKDYGKLLLRADNGGKGFVIPAAGEAIVIELNVELARTAVHDLERRKERFGGFADFEIHMLRQRFAGITGLEDAASRAAAADDVLSAALRLRDELEYRSALNRLEEVRGGEVVIENAPEGTTISYNGESTGFLLGKFESDPVAHDAGLFNFATVLLGWGWTDMARGTTAAQIDTGHRISQYREDGYTLKAHGVVWLQELGILPERAKRLGPDEFVSEQLAQLDSLLGAFGDRIAIWEAMNEPANVNTIGLPAADVMGLLEESASRIRDAGKTALVNNGHEADYGNKYTLYEIGGTPVEESKQTYLGFLEKAEAAGALGNIDIIGLQFYPGAHLAERLGGVEGPAFTPSWIVDTLDRYARFGKSIHVTECSFPSTYEDDWSSGYWQSPWTEDIQAAYLEKLLVILLGHPAVESFTWWDVSDRDASVVSGGLYEADGSAKRAVDVLTDVNAILKPSGTLEAGGEPLRTTLMPGTYTLGADGLRKEVQVRRGETAVVEWSEP